MKRVLVIMSVVALAGTISSPAFAACGSPTPILDDAVGLACPDARPLVGFGYQWNAPAVNTGTEDITCEEVGGSCLNGGIAGDSFVTVENDWANGGINGCPVVGGVANRVVFVFQAADGSGVVATISGASPDLGYNLITAHKVDLAAGAVLPLTCAPTGGRPEILGVSTSGGEATVNLRFKTPPIFSDCDADAYGAFFGTCVDNFDAAARVGQIYTSVQACGDRPNVMRSQWTAQQVTLAPDGTATLVVTLPSSNCLYIGNTLNLGGSEGGAIAGYVQLSGGLAASPVAQNVMAQAAKDRVIISWTTDSEIGLAGFNILAEKPGKGRFQVNDGLIAATGNGGGSSYQQFVARGKLQGAPGLVIESVMTDGKKLYSAPASIDK